MQDLAVSTENLSKRFGSVQAVDNISLAIPKGTIFGFLGPNGAGKTTTIHLLLGLLEPSHGTASVLGFDTRSHSAEIRASAGALLEHNGLYEQLSAWDNLDFYGRIGRLPASERQARIKDLLTEIGLWDRRHDKVGNWSRGMKQKLALARAVFHHPKILFLDEPTAGLDVEAAVAVREDLLTWVSESGNTIFLTSHNMAEIEKYCDHVAFISKGKILKAGDVDALVRNFPDKDSDLEKIYLSVMEEFRAS